MAKKSKTNAKTATITLTAITGESLYKLAGKMGISPKDVALFPAKVIAAGFNPDTIGAEHVTEANRLDRQDAAETRRKVAELNDMIKTLNARRQGTPEISLTVGGTVVEQKPAKPTKAEKQPKAEAAPSVKRVKIFGCAPTAILRWMGKQTGKKAWTAEDALTALTTLGATTLSDATVRIQMKAGAKGERGKPANITPAQAKKLVEASK